MLHLVRRFSKVVTAVESTPADMVGGDLAASLVEYTQAMEMIHDKNYSMAELELYRCMEIIEKSGFYAEPAYNFVLHRLALVQRAQRKFSHCERSLEEIVRNYKNNEKKYPKHLEFAYGTLFKQYLSSNVPKALEFADFLYKPDIWNGMTREFQKDVRFFFGVGFM